MSVRLSDNIRINAPKPQDNRYYNNLTPWSSTTQVNSGIIRALRYTGLTVNIQGDEYWYKNGIGNSNLVPKYESTINTTITDSGTTYIIAGNTTEDCAITIDYSLIRDTAYETGILKLLYDGTSVYYNNGNVIDNGGSLGVSFSADTNSQDIRLIAIATSTGVDAAFKAIIKRIMI